MIHVYDANKRHSLEIKHCKFHYTFEFEVDYPVNSRIQIAVIPEEILKKWQKLHIVMNSKILQKKDFKSRRFGGYISGAHE